jgi:hypothetical protein
VIVYEDENEKQKFDKLINEFSKIWKDERFIDVLEEQWMRLYWKKIDKIKWQRKSRFIRWALTTEKL